MENPILEYDPDGVPLRASDFRADADGVRWVRCGCGCPSGWSAYDRLSVELLRLRALRGESKDK